MPERIFRASDGTDAGRTEEKLEEMLFALGEKTVEGKSIFADVGVDQQRDFGVEFAESGEGGERNGDEIADTANIEDNLIGTFFEEAAAEESDHRMKVLPVRLGGVNETRDERIGEERRGGCARDRRGRRGCKCRKG